MCVFPSLPSLSDDAEEWRLKDHVSARFIWSEFFFFYFWTAESFLCLKKKKNFPLTFISSSFSLLGLLLWNIAGSQIIVWCWAPAVLAQDISFSPCYQSPHRPQDRAGTARSPHSGQPRSSRSTRRWPEALSTARSNQNTPDVWDGRCL